jgi:hypothetical protein
MYERAGFTLSLDSHGLTVSDAASHVQVFPMVEPNIAIDSVSDRAVVLRSPASNSNWVLQLDDAALVRGILRLSILPGPSSAKPVRVLPEAGVSASPRGVR